MREVWPRTKGSVKLFAVSCLCIVGALVVAQRWPHATVKLSADTLENPADGISLFHVVGELPSSLLARAFKPEIQFNIESRRGSVRVLHKSQKGLTAEITLQATTQPGAIAISAAANGFERGAVVLQTFRLLEDHDGDGFPDVIKLTSLDDQESFRRWFALIAESQHYRESPAWDDGQKDCSGLVRFAFREALRVHSTSWFQRVQPQLRLAAPDVIKYNYPQTPLSDKLFRTKPGPFFKVDLTNETFSCFADARTIKDYNTVFVGKDRRLAKKGDLLFYYQPGTQQLPYHMMIYLGDAVIDEAGRHDWVVYHTGPEEGKPGTIKKVTLNMLDEHPSKRWRPAPENPNFLGFFRFRILD
jgi:uncharacterized protein YfaT (DUF1175 family)